MVKFWKPLFVHSWFFRTLIFSLAWFALVGILLSVQACAPKNFSPSDDFVVQGEMLLSASLVRSVDQFVLGSGSKLVTQGNTLKIEANRLISEDGFIETFREGQIAPQGTSGKTPGDISLRAKSAIGTLVIYSRGEEGGMGVSGQKGLSGKTGFPGKRALSGHGESGLNCECEKAIHSLEKMIVAPDSFWPPDIALNLQISAIRSLHRCTHQPTDGTPGGVGSTGSKGGTGSVGGDTARILIEVQDASELDLKILPLPGIGGKGGLGGEGGDGGAGGAAGDPKLDPFKVCRLSKQGQQGARGSVGMTGDSGPDGKLQPICVRLGSYFHGDCDKFNSK